MMNNTDPGIAPEVPGIPEEMPIPESAPEVEPTIYPENPPLPVEDPETMPDEGPIYPDIPTEVPPSVQINPDDR